MLLPSLAIRAMLNSNYKLLDLTYTLDEKIPTWNGSCGFSHKMHLDHPDGCRVLSYKMHGGAGTHMDAPLHFFPEGASIADLSLENFFVPIRKIDVSTKRKSDLLISIEDCQNHEKRWGKIPPRCFIAGYTGWGEFWKTPDVYRAVDDKGQMHFPGFSLEAIEWLLERDIVGVGIDTLSPETGENGFEIHKLLLGANRYILENMASLEFLPEAECFLIALPLKIASGVESPIRAVALIPCKDK